MHRIEVNLVPHIQQRQCQRGFRDGVSMSLILGRPSISDKRGRDLPSRKGQGGGSDRGRSLAIAISRSRIANGTSTGE